MTTFTSNELQRRAVLAGLACVAALPAQALNDRQARALITTVVAEINAVIAGNSSEAAIITAFEGIFDRYGDVPAIARSALGPRARALSDRELAAYTAAFRGYMSRKYGKRFREFIGGRIEVTDAREAGRFFEVVTTVILRNFAPFEVVFVVSDRTGDDRFINLLIEGLNMLATERVEVNALLDRNGGNVASMIRDLERAG